MSAPKDARLNFVLSAVELVEVDAWGARNGCQSRGQAGRKLIRLALGMTVGDGDAPSGDRERCETCRFWDNSTQSGAAEPDTTGACRRLPPPTIDDRTGLARWPYTDETDWCGMHSRREGGR